MRYQTSEQMLADAEFLVEANSFEVMQLWKDYNDKVEWYERYGGGGFGVTVGNLDNRPVCISIQVESINGHKVLFWCATSQVVDYKMIEALWDVYPNMWASEDANNFHNIVHKCK